MAARTSGRLGKWLVSGPPLVTLATAASEEDRVATLVHSRPGTHVTNLRVLIRLSAIQA